MAVVLILGSGGQLGQSLLRARWPQELTPVGCDVDQVDIGVRPQVASVLRKNEPLLVINAAAYTAVDKAESESETAFLVNREGPRHIAELCAARHIPVFHISTDYVFDGRKTGPYLESDPVAPLGVYGKSKAEGEEAVRSALRSHIILRTSWVFSAFGQNFVKTMLRLAVERPELRVVNDQRGRPTAAQDLAAALLQLVELYFEQRELPWGTYHFAGQGTVTWYDFAAAIVELQARWTRVEPRVTPIATADYPTPARRPANSELCTALFENTFGFVPRPWRAGLEEVVQELLDRKS